MHPSERQRLAELPDRVQIFRGFRIEGGQNGLSWTPSRDRAILYAQGKAVSYGNSPLAETFPLPGCFLAQATIPRECILAFFDPEDEVIVPDFRGYARKVESLPWAVS